jgi:hypothetical protein
LSRVAQAHARLDGEEARWLVVALRSAAHLALGFATFAEYIERLFGYSPRWTSERLRVAEALEELPCMRRALEEGALSWSAVRELTRVAVADTEHGWIGVAQGRSLRQIEELVSGHGLGDSPGEPTQPTSRRVLRFEVSGETLAMFREAMAKLRRDSGGPLDDDAALLLMVRQVLGSPSDAGRSNYQIALTLCEECARARQQGSGEPIPIDTTIMEMARCDMQHIGRIGSSPDDVRSQGRTSRVAEPEVSTTPVGVAEDGCGGHAESATAKTNGDITADGDRDAHGATASQPTRARQDIPPSVRRGVMRRDATVVDAWCRAVATRSSSTFTTSCFAPRGESTTPISWSSYVRRITVPPIVDSS